MAVSPSGSELHEQIAPGPVPRRSSLVVEALGYLGAVLAVMAGLIAARQLWPVPVGTQLAFAGAAAVALLLAGVMLPIQNDPALGRLRSVLWLASAVGLAAVVGLLTGPQFANLGPAARPLVTEAAVTAYAVILWWRCRAPLQHLVTFAGTAALAGTAIAQASPGDVQWPVGVGLWALSLLWGIAVHRGYLVPRTAGYVAAGIGLLAAAQIAMDQPAGQALAVVTVAGLLAAGVALHRVLLLGLGAGGAIVLLPQVAGRYLPRGAGGAAGVLAAGVIILVVALWLAKARTKAS